MFYLSCRVVCPSTLGRRRTATRAAGVCPFIFSSTLAYVALVYPDIAETGRKKREEPA